jgi:DNA-binding cell septation regulator SpoVG
MAGLVLACDQRTRPADVAGEMSIRWSGSRDGDMTAPASATWCEGQRLLEIRSIRGDTGIALAVYPTRRPRAGSYRIVEPAKAESVPPAAGVAVRWLARNVVQGFRGDSGELQLERSSTGQLSGQVHARARSVVDTQRIRLTATFRDLIPRLDTLGCMPVDTTDEDLTSDGAGEPGDTMVN